MKRLLFIPLAVLIAFSGVSMKYAAHYCQGVQVASNVSLSGRLASCGMGNQPEADAEGYNLKNNCCNDLAISFLINSNYLFESNLILEKGKTISVSLNTPFLINYTPGEVAVQDIPSIRPPGIWYPNSVVLQSLCNFRI